jgi:hypothetical protein
MKRSLPFLASLLGLAACQSHPSQPASTSTAPAANPATAQAAVASSPGTAYGVYRVLLPGQADSSTLHLLSAPRSFALATGHFGSYYGADGHPYTLQGQPSAAPDSIVLFDTSLEKADASGAATPYWRLRRQPGRGDLAGTIGGQPVRLRRVPEAAGALTFAVRYFADSAAAFPKEAKSPKGRISLQTLVPASGLATVRETLAASLLRDLRGDTVAGQPATPLPDFYKQQRQQFFKDYREDAVASRPASADTAGVGAYGIGMNYEDQVATYVLYQQGNLLSLAYFRYSFSGGAHGNYGTTGASYDLRTGHRLRYDDIFRPAVDARLATLLGQAVRPLVGLAPSDPLDKQLFVKQMPVTHNVFLTNGGAVFIYQPYEVASYAQGELAVFVPLSKLRPLLRDGLPLPATNNLVTQAKSAGQ